MKAGDYRLRLAQRIGACALVAAVLAVVAFPSPAQDLDTETKQWREIEAALPAYPRPENLVSFSGGAASGHQFLVDALSLSVGADGVVRYTLVIKTSGGATNETHEGIRCDERQQKTYAIGQANGAWTRARDPKWRYIEARTVNNYHRVLHHEYLCEGKYPVKTPKEIVQLLRRGPPPIQVGD